MSATILHISHCHVLHSLRSTYQLSSSAEILSADADNLFFFISSFYLLILMELKTNRYCSFRYKAV